MDFDVTSPPICMVGNRAFRVNPVRPGYWTGQSEEEENTKVQHGYREEDLFGEDDEDTYEIEEKDGKFVSIFHVPRSFYGGLIGQKGLTRKRIETETRTDVKIPSAQDTKNSKVTIRGSSRKDVCGARRRIELVIDNLRKKIPPTHFTCVPACTDSIKNGFNKFKLAVIKADIPGIDEELFMGAEKLHITFGSCTLLDDDERVKAAQIFNDCKTFLQKMPNITVNVRGLEIMNDDPSSAAVLYARIESVGLQILADEILKQFKAARLNNDEFRETAKLHMTLMNVRGRMQRLPGSLNYFDAREILKNFGDYEFGKFKVKEVHLSQMHTTGPDGFYIASGIISI